MSNEPDNKPKQKHNGVARNPGGGRPENDKPPRGRGTTTRGASSPPNAQSQETEKEKRLRGEVGRDPNDRR